MQRHEGIPTIKHNEIVVIIGKKGQGKTVCFKHLVNIFLNEGWRVVLIDSEHEHGDFQHPNLEVVTPEETPKTDEATKELDDECRKILRKGGRRILAIESIDAYTDPRRGLAPNFWRIVHWGRKIDGDVSKGIGLIITARRLANMGTDIHALADHLIVYWTDSDNDVKRLKEKYSSDVVEQARFLEPYHFLYCNNQYKIYKIYSSIPLEA